MFNYSKGKLAIFRKELHMVTSSQDAYLHLNLWPLCTLPVCFHFVDLLHSDKQVGLSIYGSPYWSKASLSQFYLLLEVPQFAHIMQPDFYILEPNCDEKTWLEQEQLYRSCKWPCPYAQFLQGISEWNLSNGLFLGPMHSKCARHLAKLSQAASLQRSDQDPWSPNSRSSAMSAAIHGWFGSKAGNTTFGFGQDSTCRGGRSLECWSAVICVGLVLSMHCTHEWNDMMRRVVQI